MSQQLLMMLKLLDFVMAAANASPAILASYQKHKKTVETMIAENRDPTDEEWLALDNETNSLVNDILDANGDHV